MKLSSLFPVRAPSARLGLSVLTAIVAITPLSLAATYTAWSLQKLGTPNAAPCADEDGDGTPTIWEYYLGRNPKVADGALPAGAPTVDNTGGVSALAASLPAPTPGTDATVEWQVSPDLVTWTTVATSVNGAAFTGAGSQGVSGGLSRFRDPTPTASPQRFARWKISSATAGPGTPGAAPVLKILRDDRVATIEMDYNADNPWGQFWTLGETGRDDAGFRVTWWPDGASSKAMKSMGGCGGCAGACGKPMDGMAVAKTFVTPNRRVQLQPLVNEGLYHVRVERINALGEVASASNEMTFNGGDETRVAALRASLTHFDDFNLPEGAANERLWNNAYSTATDSRYHLFFVNAQFHSHTLNGTNVGGPHVGDRSQVAQRFRKPIAIESGVQRRIVFDMDAALAPRAVWYLDLNPVKTDLTGHADFFDMDGTTGLPAGIFRMKVNGQFFSLHRVGMDGASYKVAEVDMEAEGRQAVQNVRRAFDVRLGTDSAKVIIDGKTVIDTTFPSMPLAPGAYELLWSTIGYNSSKDNNPYFLWHWDNFGFDGPNLEPRSVHNYVTQIDGDNYQKSQRWDATFPTFTVHIPDDLRPTQAGATAEAWLVWTYQSGDYSGLNRLPTDYVRVNNAVNFPLPPQGNNSVPLNPALIDWGTLSTVRVKLGDLTSTSASPLVLGANTFQFFLDNGGITNLHVEVSYTTASEPAYTQPAAFLPFPMHHDLPKLGPPARFEQIGDEIVYIYTQGLRDPAEFEVNVTGHTRVSVAAGGETWAGWAPYLFLSPVNSAEMWSSGGTAGISKIEVFIRPRGGNTASAQRVAILTTERDAPAPLVRHTFDFDTTAFPNGEYELSMFATDATGVKSHPTYDGTAAEFGTPGWSGAYFPIYIKIAN